MTADFSYSSSTREVVEWGPGANRDGAAFVFLLGDEDTVFVKEGSASLGMGDPCTKIEHENKCNTTLPATCLLFDEFVDETIYACNGTVVGSLFLDFADDAASNDGPDIFLV